MESLRLCHTGNTRRIFKMTASHRVTLRNVRLPPGNPATGDWQKKNPFTLFEHRAKQERCVGLVLIATQYKWFFSISYILQCSFLYYRADTRTMNAMALLSLYLYFFPPFLNIFFRTSQSQPRVDATVETFFLPFFHVIFKVVPWFQTTAATFFQNFSDFLWITVVPLVYDGGIFYQWNYNGAF